MQYTPQTQHVPSAEAPPQTGKRPWLPLRQVIGLIAVGVFIIAGIAGGWQLIGARESQLAGEAAAREAANSEDIYASMSVAMLNDDREAFVHWGEGAAQEQLGRIWDETKKIGWTVGMVDRADSSDDDYDPEAFDPQRPLGSGLLIAFDLGFTQQRFAAGTDGPNPDCVAGTQGCGILTQGFEYDVVIDGGDGSTNSYRISEISPRTPMPWDDAAGVHAVRSENAVLFGYADEAQRIDALAGATQTAAAGVLQTEVATSGYSSIPGFPAFISDDNTRYQGAVYGVGEHQKSDTREWEEAGVSTISPPLGVVHGAADLAQERGLLLEFGLFGGQSGSLPMFNGSKIDGSDAETIRLAAHEFAHALEMTTFSHSIFEENSGSEAISFSFGTEGYARYVEDLVASPYDGKRLTMAPHVQEAVSATTNEQLQNLVGAEAFRSGETNRLAYDASGNYFAFMADNGVDIAEVMHSAQYMIFDPYTWTGLHYPSTASGDSVDATPDAWRAWNAR